MLFDWDDANINHIARHGITPEEAEQVIENGAFEGDAYVCNGEERTNHLGETDAGHVLLVVTPFRTGRVQVVTAHPANRSTRLEYRRLRDAHNA